MKAGAEARSSEAGRRRRWQLEEAAAAVRRPSYFDRDTSRAVAVAHGFVRCRKQHQAVCGGHSAAGLSAKSASRLLWRPMIATGPSRGLWQLHMDLCAVGNSSGQCAGCTGQVSQQIAVETGNID